MRTLVIGILGHVDHGKTALVRALTGIDTDRLEEEKRRGISIALGFAHLEVPGACLDLVDVPGHERFIRTMVAGASGIGAVLMTVSADEGVRPQTEEHAEITGLLGVRRGLVCVTKGDLGGPEAIARAAGAAGRLLERYGIDVAGSVVTSAATGSGLPELRAALARLAGLAGPAPDRGWAHLPVDRSFAVAGHGTVVTGTLRGGPLSVGDEVEIVPAGTRASIRGLQVHGRPVATVGPGGRVAVNLRSVDHRKIGRGHALAAPGMLAPAERLDVRITASPGAPPVETGRAVRLLAGTGEAQVRIRLLDRDRLEPGDTAVAQLKCAEPVALAARDPFVLRGGSPSRTLGGGIVLDPVAHRRRRFHAPASDELRLLAEEEPEATLARLVGAAGIAGVGRDALVRLTGRTPDWVDHRLPPLGAACLPDGTVVRRKEMEDLRRRILGLVTAYQERNPTAPGLPGRGLAAELGVPASSPALQAALAGLLRERTGGLVHEGAFLRRRDFDPLAHLPPAQQALSERFLATFRRAGLSPPDAATVIGSQPVRADVLAALVRFGRLVRTYDCVQKREILFHPTAIEAAKRQLRTHFHGRGFLAGEAGRLLGTTRKFSIPLLEHLDAAGFTRRDGDRRVVLQSSATPYADASPPMPARPGREGAA